MNRPGPQSLRGIPLPPSQQQMPPNRSVSSRLPQSGKMPNNGTGGWGAFGGGPMGSAGLGNARPNGPLSSFAQTIGGSSQPATPIDMSSGSEFPSLSNNPTQPSHSTWGVSGSRSLGPASSMRWQQSAMSSQQQLNAQQQTQQQQSDLFSSSSQLPSSQSSFRFSQNPVSRASQGNSVDEFPPLNHNGNGDIGQDRSTALMNNVSFGSQGNGFGFNMSNPPQPSRSNGLLNVLSGDTRASSANRVASPSSVSGLLNSRSPIDANRQGVAEQDATAFSNTQFNPASLQPQRQENIPSSTMSRPDGQPESEPSVPHAQTLDSASQSNGEETGPEVLDPLAGMSEIDKWGIKGFTYMVQNFPDYAALVSGGTDIANLGFDLQTNERLSDQIYSLWDDEPPRPAVPHFVLPECYTVQNVAPLESKMGNFNDEALIFMFYSNPGDMQQLMAATELHNRNWRYHKHLKVWLTKDDSMQPQAAGPGREQGYYVFFDINKWSRERREFMLVYEDLENLPAGIRG